MVKPQSSSAHPIEIDDAVGQLLIENAEDMIVLCDTDMTRLYVAPACLDITGYSPAELLAHNPTAILHADNADRVFQLWHALAAQRPTVSAEWRLLHLSPPRRQAGDCRGPRYPRPGRSIGIPTMCENSH
jgi:PAS domain-containing protein